MILADYYHTIAAFFFAVVAVCLMILILLQRGKGVGLAGAFGGAGGGTAFGAKTGDVLTWATIVGAVIMLAFAVVLNYVFVPRGPELSKPEAISPPGGAPATTQPAGAWRSVDPAQDAQYAAAWVFGEGQA